MFRPFAIFSLIFCFIFMNTGIPQAAIFDLFKNISRYSDDVAKLGKNATKVTKHHIDDFIKRFPSLAKKSDDLIKGAIVIEHTMQKSPVAARMINAGINPARITIAAERYPGRLKLGDEIAELFAKTKPDKAMPNLPPQALAASRRLDGSYAKAGESFLEMANRGGKKAVAVAEKLYRAATPGKAGAAIAMSLLAWHMVDPQGSEEAVENFFKEHVAPMVTAPIKGMAEAGGQIINESMESVSTQIKVVAEKNWPWIILLVVGTIFWIIPNLRKLPIIFLNEYFSKIIARLHSHQENNKGVALNPVNKLDSGASDKSHRINIYGKK